MLSPSEIRGKVFEKYTSGYRPEDVDQFLAQVANDYETLYNNNADSEEKIMKHVDKINEYREDEDAIKDALLSAQKESKRILADAKAQSEQMINDAIAQREQIEKESEVECERIIAEHKEYCAKVISENTAETEKKIQQVKDEYAQRSKDLKELKLNAAKFREQLTEIYSQQIQLVMQLPDEESLESEEAAADDSDEAPAEAVITEEAAPAQEEPKAEEAAPAAQDIPALKDESVFTNYKPREIKFSDLRFGNRK